MCMFWTDNHLHKTYFLNQRSDMLHLTGFVRVLKNLESPGILLLHYPGLESTGKRLFVLESSKNLINSSTEYEIYDRQ